MNFQAALSPVLNRGPENAKDRERVRLFLGEMVTWARGAKDELFAENTRFDIFSKISPELGPFKGASIIHRKAVILEVLRVLAGFESSWDWKEGVDTSRLGSDTNENAEAGAWQPSYDARRLAPELRDFLLSKGITSGVKFQQAMKFQHETAMEFEALLLRIDVKNPERLHNGPLYKGEERLAIRRSLRGEEHSIYRWLNRDAVAELEAALA